jgi:hypothetical protein
MRSVQLASRYFFRRMGNNNMAAERRDRESLEGEQKQREKYLGDVRDNFYFLGGGGEIMLL